MSEEQASIPAPAAEGAPAGEVSILLDQFLLTMYYVCGKDS